MSRMPGRGFQGRFIGWAAIAILATYCLFIGGAWAATYYTDLRVLALIPAFAVVAGWIIVAIRDPAWRPRTVLGPGFAAAFTAFAIGTVTSRYPRFSVEYLALAVLLTALYLILQRLMASPFFRPRLIGFAAMAAVATGIAYIAVVVPHWITWWGLIGHLAAPPLRPFFESLTFGNPSAVMTASVLLTTPAVAHLAGGSRGRRAASIGLVGLAAIVTILSGSRAGWLAVGAATLIVGALWLAVPDHRSSLVALARSRSTRIIAVPLLTVAVAVAVVAGPGLLLRATAGGDGARPTYYAVSIRMFQSSPLVGTGPGTWVPQRIAYTQPGETDYYIPHAHSIYLQTLAEFGIVGLLGGLGVVIALGRLLFGAIRDADPARRRMAWAALFATVYFAAHQVLDLYVNAPAILFAFAIPIAWLDATAPEGMTGPTRRWVRAVPGKLGVGGRIAGVGTIVAAAAFLGWSESGALLMSRGTDLLNERKPMEALEPLAAAVRADPAMPPYQLALGLALADTGDLKGAEARFSMSATMDGLPEAWLNLAAVRARLGDGATVDEALVQALRLGNQQAGVAMGAGVVELQLGKTDAAVRSFAGALLLNPTLAGDPWWTSDPARAVIWPNVLEVAFGQASATSRFVLALETGDSTGAASAIAAMDDSETAATSDIVLAAWNGDADALARIQARARQRPLDMTVINWCALLLRRSGDTEAAARYATWAETVNGDSSIGGYEMRVVTDGQPHFVAGINSLFYGHYTYRRPVPSHQLVGWLPELGYQ
jgi:O-antigen ligase